MKLIVAGLDPSLRNTGLCKGTYDTETNTISITHLKLVQTEKQSGKQIRVNSDDIRCGNEIVSALHEWIADCHVVFAEIPSGGQSASAAKALGISTGILASIGAVGAFKGKPVQVMPAEVKMAACGSKVAAKEEMIEWAHGRFPDAQGWCFVKRAGVPALTAKNEHLADAIGAVNAGVQTNEFKQLLSTLSALTQ